MFEYHCEIVYWYAVCRRARILQSQTVMKFETNNDNMKIHIYIFYIMKSYGQRNDSWAFIKILVRKKKSLYIQQTVSLTLPYYLILGYTANHFQDMSSSFK